jgi:hypothetical protein
MLFWLTYQLYAEAKVDSGERLEIKTNFGDFTVSSYSNYPLDKENAAIARAIIVIHGINRDADKYYETTIRAAKQAGNKERHTIIIAPRFPTEADIEAGKAANDALFWSQSGWKQGDESKSSSSHSRQIKASSFETIDLIIQKLCNRKNFPNLRMIVIAGHSAGAQFVNRYAAGNIVEQEVAEKLGIKLRYIVANPSSYLYFDNKRVVSGTDGRFAVPPAGIVAACPDYDEYRYGLVHLNSYMKKVGDEQIRSQYLRREVIYLLGDKDSKEDAENLDKDCAAETQGPNRLARGKIYYNYLKTLDPNVTERQKLKIVPDISHSSSKIFNSPVGMKYLFE